MTFCVSTQLAVNNMVKICRVVVVIIVMVMANFIMAGIGLNTDGTILELFPETFDSLSNGP